MIKENDHEYWMQHALQLACRARDLGEVPVGAVVVKDNQLLSEGWNSPIQSHNPAAHAEVMAIQQAALRLSNYRIPDTTLYVTLEPCPMCAGLMIHARIARLVFGAFDNKTGCAGSIMDITRDSRLNHQVEVVGGVLESECSTLLSDFFRERRRQQKQLKQQRLKSDSARD
ncbi:tRNA adenosine(34) deaminase TadA [Alteromonas flava]|uniref:tRNA adenosine(34) deaminase TadA n=1 Tax=Alteromonas flava TaxID=2048003 RepID=UPI000C281E5E|nr:tRNA adenosine(34) deaminase TadA [Alteromonas flava]